jgi:oligopeptide/dipeptide ABC transporter ATP-binding protein
VLFRREDGQVVDVAKLRDKQLRPIWRDMQMIFQDPFGSLNPRKNLLDIIGEPMLVQGVRSRQKRMDRVAELLNLVGLRPEYMHRYPHAFSGGQRQRIVIARALTLEPRLVIADEAVSALDVSVQAQILNLLLDLQRRLKLSYLFVAHDLSIVKHISHRVAVMYVGKVVELAADRGAVHHPPKHPYTSALLRAVPVPDPDKRAALQGLPGEVANPAAPPRGCYFHPRCPFAVEHCRQRDAAAAGVRPGTSSPATAPRSSSSTASASSIGRAAAGSGTPRRDARDGTAAGHVRRACPAPETARRRRLRRRRSPRRRRRRASGAAAARSSAGRLVLPDPLAHTRASTGAGTAAAPRRADRGRRPPTPT